MGAKITVLIVCVLVVAAGAAAWLKAPSWDELAGQIDAVQSELVAQMGAQMPTLPTGAPDPKPDGQAADSMDRVAAARVGDDGSVEEGSRSVVALYTQDDAEAALAGRRVMYQFSDETGRVHFVDRIEQVPKAYRSSVGRIEMGGRDTNRAEKAAAKRSTRRPSWMRPAKKPYEYDPGGDKDVVVYMATWCGACKATMKHLDQKGIDYETTDVDRDHAAAREIMSRVGGSSLALPTVDIEGDLIQGHDPRRLDQLLL